MGGFSIFEAMMLLCFGIAWPFSIAKLIRTRKSAGKSVFFLLVVLAGYLSGIAHKAFISFDKVIILYVINALMVAIDLALTLKYQDPSAQEPVEMVE